MDTGCSIRRHCLISKREPEPVSLIHKPEFVQGPDAEDDVADDLVLVDAADGGVAGVDGDLAVVPHDEDLALGDLVGEFDVGNSVGLGLVQVGLVDHFLVDVDVPVLVDVDPFAAAGDDALDQDIVVIVKGDDLAGTHVPALDGEDDVSVVEGAVHGLSVNVEDRQEEDGDQDGDGGDRDQAEDGAAEGPVEAPPVIFLLQFLLQLGAGGQSRILSVWISHL